MKLSRGGTSLYKLYRYPKGRVFAPFWSENEYTFCPLWSGIGYGFLGNYGSVWTYLSFQFQMSKKEREYANSKWILRNLFFRKAVYFCCVSIRDQSFNNFENHTMKLSANEAKLTGLCARNCAIIQQVFAVLEFVLGLSRNGPQVWKRVWKMTFLVWNRVRIREPGGTPLTRILMSTALG